MGRARKERIGGILLGLALVALPLGCADGNLAAASQDDYVPPQFLDDVMPVYPEWALDQGITARLEVSFVVGFDSLARDFLFVSDKAKPSFDSAVAKSLRASHYLPATRAGIPVEARIRRIYNFEL